MAKKNKKNIEYTLMFIPDDNGKTFSLRIGRKFVRSVILFLFLFVLGIAVLLAKTGEVGIKLQLVDVLKLENKKLRIENDKLKDIWRKLESMRSFGEYLQRLALVTNQNIEIPKLEDNSQVIPSVSTSTSSTVKKYYNGNDLKEIADATPNIRPVEGWVTKRYSPGDGSGSERHLGVDFVAPEGALVRAAAPGIVEDVFNDKYFGWMAVIKHGHGYETRYGHCSQILVSKGESVQRGQAIALLGNTGRSSGPHLHFEVIKNGIHIDPMKNIVSRSTDK